MKKILIIAPFDPIYPPMNGGMQRCFNILHQLAIHSDLTAIIHQRKNDFLKSIKDYPAIESVRIYSTNNRIAKGFLHFLSPRVENALRSRWYQRVWNTPADSSLLKYYPILIQVLKNQKFDIIILENPAATNAVRIIRRYDKKVKIIFDAHNVETNLAKSLLQHKKLTLNAFRSIENFESKLYNLVDEIFVCSEKDKRDLNRMNKGLLKISVVPNGVTICEKLVDAAVKLENPSEILFCGVLGTIANSEGLLWFYHKIWPNIIKEFPFLKILILSNALIPNEMKTLKEDERVVFTGIVKDVKTVYNRATISIVPLKTGSGTRLKILEAMGFGVPVVSTSIGAEGIECVNNRDLLLSDNEEAFAESVKYLLRNKNERIRIQQNARRLVRKQYDWNIIGRKLAKIINGLPTY